MSALHTDIGLMLKMSALETLDSGQFTLSTQLIILTKLAILPLMQYLCFFRNLLPLTIP